MHVMNGASRTVGLLLAMLLSVWPLVHGHGRLVDPPARGTMWRLGFDTPKDYNDHELYCGGFDRQWGSNSGKCGECGDPYDMERPRPHEAGGTFGTGVLSKVYRQGETITATVHLTANHAGWFEFRLCPTNSPLVYAKQSCLNKMVLELADYPGTRYRITNQSQGLFRVKLKLPEDLICSHCVLQWHYTTGNNWGFCRDGTDKMGCGRQEVFRGCSDVAIFAPNDYTYYNYLNLTTVANIAPIINLSDGSYVINDNSLETNSKENIQYDTEDKTEIISVEEHQQDSEENNEIDDLDILDTDGDGIINIAGNHLSLDLLKKHLRESGLLIGEENVKSKNSISKFHVNSEESTPVSTTSRSRSKFKSVRQQAKPLHTTIKPRNTKYVVSRKSQHHIAQGQDNQNYVPSDKFRRGSYFVSYKPTVLRTTESSRVPIASVPAYTLGPIIVHDEKSSEERDEHDENPNNSAIHVTTSVPDLIRRLQEFNRQLLPDHLISYPTLFASPTSSQNKRLNTDSIKNLHASSVFSPNVSSSSIRSDDDRKNVASESRVQIPNVVLPNSLLRHDASTIAPETQTFPTNIFSPIEKFVTTTSRPIARKPTSSINHSTSDSFAKLEATIRNVAQSYNFEKLKLKRNPNKEIQGVSPALPVTQPTSSKTPDMSGAVAFQVRLSRLRDASTVDRLMKLKESLRPESQQNDDHDPMLLIIM